MYSFIHLLVLNFSLGYSFSFLLSCFSSFFFFFFFLISSFFCTLHFSYCPTSILVSEQISILSFICFLQFLELRISDRNHKLLEVFAALETFRKSFNYNMQQFASAPTRFSIIKEHVVSSPLLVLIFCFLKIVLICSCVLRILIALFALPNHIISLLFPLSPIPKTYQHIIITHLLYSLSSYYF